MARHLWRHRFRILAYHGVDEAYGPIVNFDGFQVPVDVFKKQMDILAKHYRVWPLARMARNILDGGELPDNLVALTFDDGYRNNWQVAAPILKEYGFPATFFVTTGFIDGTHKPWWYRLRSAIAASHRASMRGPGGVTMGLGSCSERIQAVLRLESGLKSLSAGKRQESLASLLEELGGEEAESLYPFMDWLEVKALAEAGFDVGPHTVSHVNVAMEDGVVMAQEIRHSIERIREITGCVVRAYSYPYGEEASITDEVRKVLVDVGVCCAVTTVPGMNDRKSDPYLLKRFNITGNHGRLSFDAVLSGLRPF